MAKLTTVSTLTLLLALSVLVSIPETKCEVAEVVKGGNARHLLQTRRGTTTRRRGVPSPSSSSTAPGTGSEPVSDDDDGSTIGLRGEEDKTYCTLCPEESECEVCCCFDGECVDREEAEKGTATCTEVEAFGGGTPSTALECAGCTESDCDLHFHWCPI